ncbi:hypothetical protein AMTR_s00044p00097620 [Amborella trichopoda]|uniref:Uncharacterized protein n=1 Tax=Amborella trichopoda TaxID=13333 RepID=U5D3U4_AMBTC|nr:hypothetical protein AMTR_s00044p00097620 [Amborella trichopoda]
MDTVIIATICKQPAGVHWKDEEQQRTELEREEENQECNSNKRNEKNKKKNRKRSRNMFMFQCSYCKRTTISSFNRLRSPTTSKATPLGMKYPLLFLTHNPPLSLSLNPL